MLFSLILLWFCIASMYAYTNTREEFLMATGTREFLTTSLDPTATLKTLTLNPKPQEDGDIRRLRRVPSQ